MAPKLVGSAGGVGAILIGSIGAILIKVAFPLLGHAFGAIQAHEFIGSTLQFVTFMISFVGMIATVVMPVAYPALWDANSVAASELVRQTRSILLFSASTIA